jgi:hypothetical protein
MDKEEEFEKNDLPFFYRDLSRSIPVMGKFFSINILNLGDDTGFSHRLFGLIFPIAPLKEGPVYLS